MSEKLILCIGTLDSKGPEVRYITELIDAEEGIGVLTMDIGTFRSPTFAPDISADELALLAGSTIEEVRAIDEAGPAAEIMAIGARRKVAELFHDDRFHAVLAIGGGMGSEVASAAMRELPIGVPKLMLSSQKIVQAGIARYVENKDILIFPSTADLVGLNRLTRDALGRAVGAVVGMLRVTEDKSPDKPLVFMSMTGLTTSCGLLVKSQLELDGYEVVVFPAIGVGGQTLEELLGSYSVEGVIELALNEIGNELFGGMASAGPDRLQAAGEMGIPQIITPGCIDILNFLSPDTIPPQFADRPLCYHNPQATLPRLNGEELSAIALHIAAKLNQSSGRVTVMIPRHGFSALDKAGMEFYDPAADQAFIDTILPALDGGVEVLEVDAHINDPAFAHAVVAEFGRIVRSD